MTGSELVYGLNARLSELFKGYSLLNKSGVMQEVKIFNQYCPQPSGLSVNNKSAKGINNYDSNDYDSNFPCIIIQSRSSKYLEERNLEQALHKIILLIGIYDDNYLCQGWADIANIEDRIINDFMINRVIAGKYNLEMPLTFKFNESDSWPVYFGELELNYTIGRALMRHDYIYKRRER